MRIRRLAMFGAVGLLLMAPVRVQAQPLFANASSIEATIINADEVVLGKVVSWGGSPDRDNFGASGVTIEYDQILKEPVTGPLATLTPPRRMGVRVICPPATLVDWQAQATRLLVARGYDTAGAATVIEMTPGKAVVLTADFRLLRDPDEVLGAAREVIRRTPAPVRRLHTFRLPVPFKSIAGTRWQEVYGTGGTLLLDVPVDERLERRAHDDLRSDQYSQRDEGIQALRYFRSEANITRAKALLNDPGWSILAHAPENQGVEVRFYGIRQHAYEALRAWGEEVEKPIVREEIRPQS